MSRNGDGVGTRKLKADGERTESGQRAMKQLKISEVKKQNIDNRIAEDDKYLLILRKMKRTE